MRSIIDCQIELVRVHSYPFQNAPRHRQVDGRIPIKLVTCLERKSTLEVFEKPATVADVPPHIANAVVIVRVRTKKRATKWPPR